LATEQICQGPIGRFSPGSELAWERKGSVVNTLVELCLYIDK